MNFDKPQGLENNNIENIKTPENKKGEDFDLIPIEDGSFRIVFKKEIFDGKTQGVENEVDFIEDDKYIYISSIELAQSLKGKGYGQETYIKLNDYAKTKGKILHSDKRNSITGSAANVWNALIKKGVAIKISENEYRFKYDEEK